MSTSSVPGHIWQPPTPEHLQSELPQYEILGLLGRGGMGAVYKARQRSLDREVAIKVLPPNIEDGDMQYARRFKAEAQAMARLNHPGIISVYDAGETPGGLLYFVMEFVHGTDVSQMIASSGRLPPEHAHAIAAHVCDALAYAHAHGLIHRDIKPANIMVDMQGRVKVADFGLAKVASDNTGFTHTHMAVGTPDFVAPEALMPGIPVDSRADLYAVGVMLYQMLTGSIPRGAWQLPSVRLPGLDPRFDQIILKAMQMDREARHASAAELRRHLDSLLLPAVSAPELQQYSSGTLAKNPAPAAKAAAPAAPAPNKKAFQSAAAPPPPKSKVSLFIALSATAALAAGAFFFMSGRKQPAERSPAAAAETPPAPAPPEPSAPEVTATPKEKSPQKIDPPAPTAPKRVTIASAKPAEPPVPTGPAATPMPAPAPAPTPSLPPPTPAATATAADADAAPAAPASVLDQRLAALESAFQAAIERDANTAYKAGMSQLNQNYAAALDRALATASQEARLEDAVALRAEKQRAENGDPPPSEAEESARAQVPAVVKSLRGTWRTTAAQHEAAKAKAMEPIYAKYDQALAAIQADLTKEQKLDDALRLKTLREQVATAKAQFTGPIPAAVATASAATTPTPATSPTPTAAPLPSAAVLAKEGFTNSLEMKFVPVTGTDVLFCIHETRYKDYAAFATNLPEWENAWKEQTVKGIAITERAGDHPVTNVNWKHATAFCEWLSKKEGRTYRLPTDREWSIAVGIGREEKWTPETTPATVNRVEGEYPWGTKWPPPLRSGNFADETYKKQVAKEGTVTIEGYNDGFPTTAPVMSFRNNRYGLYDMAGNVLEWVQDHDDKVKKGARTYRGGSWNSGISVYLLSSGRLESGDYMRGPFLGFRIVLVPPASATR